MVRCADCGFLVVRDRPTGAFVEVTEGDRVHGLSDEYHQEYTHFPICFARKANLAREGFEVLEAQARAPDPHRLGWRDIGVRIISQDRQCEGGFTPWQQGFTPKEHREMLDQERMMEREERRDREVREWQRMESHSNRRWRFWEFVVAVLGVLAIVGITLTAAFIERGGQPIINVIVPSSTSDTATPQP